MKKMIIIILLLFIVTAILSINFTFQASGSFREFEGDDDDHDDDSYNSDPFLVSAAQNSTLTLIWNKTYGDDTRDILFTLGIVVISVLLIVKIKKLD